MDQEISHQIFLSTKKPDLKKAFPWDKAGVISLHQEDTDTFVAHPLSKILKKVDQNIV